MDEFEKKEKSALDFFWKATIWIWVGAVLVTAARCLWAIYVSGASVWDMIWQGLGAGVLLTVMIFMSSGQSVEEYARANPEEYERHYGQPFEPKLPPLKPDSWRLKHRRWARFLNAVIVSVVFTGGAGVFIVVGRDRFPLFLTICVLLGLFVGLFALGWFGYREENPKFPNGFED